MELIHHPAAANGLFAAGGIVGCVTLMGVADKIGRIRTIQAICIISIVASIIQTASVHIGMFLFARFLSGVGYVRPIPLLIIFSLD